MPQQARFFIAVGAIVAALAVAAGAFGAHGLKSRFGADGVLDAADEYQLANWETAARYQMYHGLGLLALGLACGARPAGAARAAGWAFIVGTAIFSGCLYALVLTGQRWLGAVVPIGGTLLIVGWACFALAVIRSRPASGDMVPSAADG